MLSLSQETAIRSLGLPANNSLTSHTNAHEAKEGKRKWINNTLFTLYACRCVINTVSGEVFGLFRGIKSITFWIIHYQIKKQIFLNLAVCLIFMKLTSTLNFTTCTNQSFFFKFGTYPLGETGDVLVEGLGGEDVGSGGRVGAGVGVAWRAGRKLALLEDQVQ